MALSSGSRLGPYEILGTLGAGGMGEVYKARDGRLDRLVAIKVLPDRLAADVDLRQRFEREARAVAALQHAHICTLHDVGHQNGTDYLVMEYLEGQTLAERLQRGALPIDRLIRYSLEIADALDQAHRSGIVHRDLKPGNIMLTASGIKLLDFGLAKLRPRGAIAGMSDALTQTSPLTDQGTILGTLAYMAPEQIEGQPVDHRADIWAFGCIVYEMASGRRTFEGKSHAGTIAAILERDPEPLSKRQPVTPPSLDRLVSRCLAKDPDDRWQNARDLFLELRALPMSEAPSAATLGRFTKWLVAGALALALIIIASVGFVLRTFSSPERTATPGPVLRLSIAPGPGASFPEMPAIAPDATRVAFVGTSADGIKRLWIWGMDSARADMVAGTEGAALPFWAPDSKRVAFFAGGKLKRVDVAGGGPQQIADAPNGGGGSWSPDGTILFAPDAVGGLSRVPAAGGNATPVTMIDRPVKGTAVHRRPWFLPDGDHFLYLAQDLGDSSSRVHVASLQTPANATPLLTTDSEVVFSSGYLIYARGPRLLAQPFDLRRFETTGEAVLIAENVPFQADRGSYAAFSVSSSGIVCYTSGGGRGRRQFVWLNHAGNLIRKVGPAEQFRDFDVSRDRRRVVVARYDSDRGLNDLWLMDVERGALSRLTTEPVSHTDPMWAPDGRHIAFSVREKVFFDIHQRGTEANARDEVLLASDVTKYVEAWSPDGHNILFCTRKGNSDVWILPLTGPRKPRIFLENGFIKDEPEFSPDGKWVAYHSNETGRWEVYVTSFPNADQKFQISTDGGLQPHWRADARELFYLALDGTLMSVKVETSGGLTASLPATLFATGLKTNPGSGQYAVSADGQQFLLLTDVETERSPAFTVLLNWRTLLPH